MLEMSRRDKLVQLVTEVMLKTASRYDILHQRLPKPGEFAEDVVDYLYGVANAEEKETTKE